MLLGGLLEINNVLKKRTLIKNDTDANELLEIGIYRYSIENGLPINFPSNLDRGLLLVFNNLGCCVQMILNCNDRSKGTTIYLRYILSNIIGIWTLINE